MAKMKARLEQNPWALTAKALRRDRETQASSRREGLLTFLIAVLAVVTIALLFAIVVGGAAK